MVDAGRGGFRGSVDIGLFLDSSRNYLPSLRANGSMTKLTHTPASPAPTSTSTDRTVDRSQSPRSHDPVAGRGRRITLRVTLG
jgi:hypothetical protein